MKIPTFENKKDLFEWLTANKSTLIAQKKAIIRHADNCVLNSGTEVQREDGVAIKANEPITEPKEELNVVVAINTTNILDSHKDVHIPGLWKKSLKENGANIMHLREHKSGSFEHIIANGADLKAYTKTYSFAKLGYPQFEGSTQALMFDSKVRKDRNPFMHNQYAKGYVTNHSVGMRYVKIYMCVNSTDYPEEYAMWEKYYPQIANKADADKIGYFFAVTEAKVIEGSAVPMGSNFVTPTVDNNKEEPGAPTPQVDDTEEPTPNTLIGVADYFKQNKIFKD